MFTSKPPTCAGRTLALPRKDRDIRYLRPLGNSDIANFFIRDATNGSTLPIRLRPGAPTSAIDIAASGRVGFGTASPLGAVYVENTPSDDVDDFIVTDDGLVGIGTASPANALHVRQASAGGAAPNGTSALVVEHDSDTSIEIISPNAVIGRILFSDQAGTGSGRISYNHSNDEMFFQTAATTRMSIDNGGNVVISGAISEFPKWRKYLTYLSFLGESSVRPVQVGGFDVNIVIHRSTAVRGRGGPVRHHAWPPSLGAILSHTDGPCGS